MPARVHRQILRGQLPFLLLIFFAIPLWFSHRFENALLSTNPETARCSSQVVVFTVQASMLLERSHAERDHVVEKIPREAETDIEILLTQLQATASLRSGPDRASEENHECR